MWLSGRGYLDLMVCQFLRPRGLVYLAHTPTRMILVSVSRDNFPGGNRELRVCSLLQSRRPCYKCDGGVKTGHKGCHCDTILGDRTGN